MLSEKDNFEDALKDFTHMKSFQPYKLGGKWFIAKTKEKEFTAYRTKKAASKNSILENIWVLKF